MTKVIFRKLKGNDHVIAVIPEEPADITTGYVTGVDRYGHFGVPYYPMIDQSVPATSKEYADLKAYLEHNYGYVFDVRKKRSSRMYIVFLKRMEEYRKED